VDEEDRARIVTELVKEVLAKIGIAAEVAVTTDEDGNFKVDIRGQDLGALIGYHGESLSSLQLFLHLAVHRRLGEWHRVLVDIEGYRAEREQRLYDLARRTADRVRFLQTPVTLSPMPAFERRLIHMALADEEGVETESIGEGWERRVVVKPKMS